MDRDTVMRWVAKYERAWREDDVSAVDALFTADARYPTSPYGEPEVGHEAIRSFWLDDAGEVFSMTAEPVAVDGRNAVVRVEVCYGTRSARSTGTFGCCASQQMDGSRRSRSGRTGPGEVRPRQMSRASRNERLSANSRRVLSAVARD